jgi:predicted transcriptional regulator
MQWLEKRGEAQSPQGQPPSEQISFDELIAPNLRLPRQSPNKNRDSTDISTVSEKEWAKRLRPFTDKQLAEIDGEEFLNTRAAPATLNQSMETALASRDSFARLNAWMRCKVFRMPVAEYAIELGIAENTVRRLETSPLSKHTRMPLDFFTSVIQGWERMAMKKDLGPVTANCKIAVREFLTLLPGVSQNSSFGVLNAWRYRVGKESFEYAIEASSSAYWARQKSHMYYSFYELLNIGRDLKMLPHLPANELQSTEAFKELEKAWLKDCSRLGRSNAMAKIHILLALAETPVGGTTLHQSDFGLSLRASTSVSKFEPIEWRTLLPVIFQLQQCGVIGKESNLSRLRTQLTSDLKRFSDSTEAKFREIAKERGIDNGMIADAFGLRTKNREKPALPIYRALNWGEYDRSVPSGVVAILLGRTQSEIADLLKQKRTDIKEYLARKQSTIVSPIYIERMLWKVDYKDLPFLKEKLQQLEWRPAYAELDAQEVINAVLKVGLEKAEKVLNRWNKVNTFSTVTGAISSMLYHTPDNALEAQLSSSAVRLKRIAADQETPPLPTLRKFLTAKAHVVSPALELDWYDSFAKYCARSNESDIERLLSTYIASTNETHGQYFKDRNLNKVSCAALFAGLRGAGTINREDLETVIERMKIPTDSLFARLLLSVEATGSIAEGIPALIASLNRNEEREELKGLKALRKTLRYFKQEAILQSREQIPLVELLPGATFGNERAPSAETIRRALEFRRQLPGISSSEIFARGIPFEDKPEYLIDRMFSRGAERNISERDLAYCLTSTVPVVRHVRSTTALAVEKRVLGPLTAPAVLAHLVAGSPEEIEGLMNLARATVSRNLALVGITPRALQIETRLWGLRDDDLGANKKGRAETLRSHSIKSLRAKKLADEIQEQGQTKVAIALDRMNAMCRSTFTPEITAVFIDKHPTGAFGLAADAALPVGEAARFAEGKAVPSLGQLRRMAAASDTELNDRHRLGWHFSIAEFLSTRSAYALDRFISHLAISHMEKSEEPADRKLSLVDNAKLTLLKTVNLDTPQNMGILRNPQRRTHEHWDLAKKILAGMGHDAKSPLYDFALCTYIHNDMSAAVKSWGKGMSAQTSPFPDLTPLRNFCSSTTSARANDEKTTISELFKEKETLIENQGQEGEYRSLLGVAEIFYGARVRDFVGVTKGSRYEQNFQTLIQGDISTKRRSEKPLTSEQRTSRDYLDAKRALDAATIARHRDELEATGVITQLKELLENSQQEIEIGRLVQKLVAANKGAVNGMASRPEIVRWCAILGSPGLTDNYSSVYISVEQGVRSGMAAEEAFVRKYVDLMAKIAERRKASESGEQDRIFKTGIIRR